MIKLTGIYKAFGQEKVLQDINLQIREKEQVALIGASGSGKSTLLKIILGLLKADRGEIRIMDTTPTPENILELRHNIGYVIQEGGLFPHLSCFENITLLASHLEMDKNWMKDRVNNLCELTKIRPEILDRYPAELSGGQQQRVGLMRALMMDPPLILLDEPLASIDPLVRYELQNDLLEIFNNMSKTVLLVTHDLGEAAFLSDRIILMHKAGVVQDASFEEIMENPATPFVNEFINAQRSPVSGI